MRARRAEHLVSHAPVAIKIINSVRVPANAFLVQIDDDEIAKVPDFGSATADSARSEATTRARTAR